MKPISHVSDHHGFVHGPSIVADDKPLYSHAVSPDAAVVRPEGMAFVHRLTLSKDRVLPPIPDRVLTMEMENQVGLFTDLFAAVILHLTPTGDLAEEGAVKLIYGSPTMEIVHQDIFQLIGNRVFSSVFQVETALANNGERSRYRSMGDKQPALA